MRYSLESERSVLAAMMLDPVVCADVSEALTASDFWLVVHAEVFTACAGILREGGTPDLVSVSARTQGATEFLVRIMDGATTSANWATHSGTVRELARARRFDSLVSTAAKTNGEWRQVSHQLARELEENLEEGSDDTEPLAKGLGSDLLSEPSPYPNLGFESLSKLKVEPGNMCVIGARPSCGKSALLGTLALNIARNGWNVLFVSLEMPAKQIRDRMLSAQSGTPLERVQERNDPGLIQHASELSKLPISIVDAAMMLDVERISGIVRRWVRRQSGHSVVMIDYLQLVTSRERHDKRYEVVGHICRELKRIALRNKIPLFVAAQLSRAAEERKNEEPRLSDFRESGEIEQTADQALLMHPTKDRTYIRIAKYRMGPQWTAEVKFIDELCMFRDFGGWQ